MLIMTVTCLHFLMISICWMFAATLPKGSDVQQFQDAEARVKANLSNVPATPLKGVAAYRDYVLQVDTMPVRGICCCSTP